MWFKLFAWVLLQLNVDTTRPQKCTASVFGYAGDKYGSSPTLLYRRPVDPLDVGIAHRKHPIGSWVLVTHKENTILARVIDRGPYGALDDEGQWYIKYPEGHAEFEDRNGEYRGCVDLTPRAAMHLEHDGWGKVKVRRIK